MRFSPFSTTSRRKFQKVGSEATGHIFLEVTNGIHPVERTEEVQAIESELSALDRDRVSLLWSMLKISEREAQKRGIPLSEAREELFGDRPEVTEGNAIVVRKNPIELVQSEEELRNLLAGSGQEDKIDALRNKLKRLIATNLMSSRLGWAVEVEDCRPKSVQLNTVRPVVFGIAKHSKIRFEDVVVIVSDEGVSEWEDVIPVEKTTAKVSGVGFLLDEFGREKVGSSWSLEATDSLLNTKQIDAIYEFYLQQDAGGPEAIKAAEAESQEVSDEEKMGNSSPALNGEVPPPESTGEKSSSGSKLSVVAIGG